MYIQCNGARAITNIFLWESPPYHHSFAGVPAIYISFSFAGVPAILFFFFLRESPPILFFFLRESSPHINVNCGSPRHISISIAGVPAHLGLHSFQFHQFHPNLISKDEENNWSSTVFHNVIIHRNFTRSSSQ